MKKTYKKIFGILLVLAMMFSGISGGLYSAVPVFAEEAGVEDGQEIPEIPVEALREAVINAFAHRSIESRQSVEIAVYRSFLDITSHGSFPIGMTPEMFIEDDMAPVRRNPLLTRLLYYSKDMEGFATGLKRIHELCEGARVRVEYECGGSYFRVRFYRRQANSTQPGTQPGTSYFEKAIVDLVRADRNVTRAEIAETLGISVRKVQRIINGMDGIEFVGHGRHGHWNLL